MKVITKIIVVCVFLVLISTGSISKAISLNSLDWNQNSFFSVDLELEDSVSLPAQSQEDISFYSFPVPIYLDNDPITEYDVYVLAAENPDVVDKKTVYLIHGFAHNASSFKPLIYYILSKYKNTISKIYAIDIPGHGMSFDSFNSNIFGTLNLKDHVDANLQVLDYLTSANVSENQENINYIIGHSLGGMILQMSEQRLKQGSSLMEKYGVEGVMLIASTLPDGIPWDFAESGEFLKTMLPLIDKDENLGLYACVGDQTFRDVFLPGVPEDIVTNDDIDTIRSRESIWPGMEMGGYTLLPNIFRRPIIDENIFANYRIASVSYENDSLLTRIELETLHEHLGGETDNFHHITDGYPVHDGFYITPRSLRSALNYLFNQQ